MPSSRITAACSSERSGLAMRGTGGSGGTGEGVGGVVEEEDCGVVVEGGVSGEVTVCKGGGGIVGV